MILVSTDGAAPVQHMPEGKSLLLVDDDPYCARFIGHAANEYGYEAVVTLSPQSFKAQYRSIRPDVVLIDLAMPGVDGIELLRFLTEEQCQAIVVIISGFDRRVVEAAMRLGTGLGLRMGGALTKPFRPVELAEAIEKSQEPGHGVHACE